MAAFRPAYLIHGDDHGRLAERRAKLRALAEAESGVGGVEVLEGDACTPAAVEDALTAMTFALGRRFIIADGVERWKERDVEPVAAALRAVDPDAMTLAFFAREDGRVKAPDSLAQVVEAVGGQVAAENAVHGRALPRWLVERAKELGYTLDTPGAKALIAQVGERPQRLVRELEKLGLEHGTGARIGAEEIVASSASSAERRAWTLADALVAGDARAATTALIELRGQGERLASLMYGPAGILKRLRDALSVAEALAAGQPPAQVKKSLRMPSFVAERLIADVAKRDVGAYRRALAVMADLELETRGGGGGVLSEETAALRAVLAAAA